jgi:streptogramin lyase
VLANVSQCSKGLLVGLALTFGLSACGGGNGGATTLNAPILPSRANLASVLVTFTIRIPKGATSRSKTRSPKYISTAIQAIDFRLTGVSPAGVGTYAGALNADTLVPVTYGNVACSTDGDGDKTCTAAFTAPAPATDTWTISTYAVASPVIGTTTPLSIYAGYSLAVTVAGPNNASVSTWGVPTALGFSPAAASVSPTDIDTLTTSLQVRDAGGATLIGGENFSTSAGVAGSVHMTGCDAKLTPTPATVNAANPAALGAGAISVVYNGSGTAGTTLHCNATAPNGLTAQYSVNVATAAISEYTGMVAGANPRGIAAGPDGNLWFTEFGAPAIGKVTTAGVITEYSAGITASSQPYRIAAGSDGNLWFTEYHSSNSKIGKITTAGVITEYTAGMTAGAQPYGIAAGSDGNLWFAEEHNNAIGKITTAGVITEYLTTPAVKPTGICAGPDGNLWFTENTGNAIGKITTAGVITEYTAGMTASALPYRIVAGPDGNLWFTEFSGNRIGKITTAGGITEYSTGMTASANPAGIAAGPDGNLWFTELTGNRIGKITTAGTITEYAAGINAPAAPGEIVTGSDGNLWFTELSGNRIGKMVP